MLSLVDKRDENSVVKHYIPTPFDVEKTDIKVKDISAGAQMVIWSIRQWAQCKHRNLDYQELVKAYSQLGVPEGVSLLDEFMTLLANVAMRPVRIECSCAVCLSSDELLLLRVFRAAQSNKVDAANERMRRLIHGSLCTTFCRIISEYTQLLSKVDMSLNQITGLSVAEESDTKNRHSPGA